MSGPLIHLTRTLVTPSGVFGRWLVEGWSSRLFTVEDDWLGNRKGVSCIPDGHYALHRTIFQKHGYECFEVADVPGRTRILVHIANTENDVEGCIGLGLQYGKLWVPDEDAPGPVKPMVWKDSVTSSRIAFDRFMVHMAAYDVAELDVTWGPGLPPSLPGGIA